VGPWHVLDSVRILRGGTQECIGFRGDPLWWIPVVHRTQRGTTQVDPRSVLTSVKSHRGGSLECIGFSWDPPRWIPAASNKPGIRLGGSPQLLTHSRYPHGWNPLNPAHSRDPLRWIPGVGIHLTPLKSRLILSSM
jgi:hypothetical protein